MKQQRIGKRTIRFRCPPSILAWSGIVGQKEGEGPLGSCFDRSGRMPCLAKRHGWEAAESAMQKEAIETALKKGNIRKGDIDCIFAGDLLGQLIATSFGLADFSIPLFGVYGACSTMERAWGWRRWLWTADMRKKRQQSRQVILQALRNLSFSIRLR